MIDSARVGSAFAVLAGAVVASTIHGDACVVVFELVW